MDKLQTRYVSEFATNELIVLNNILNTKLRNLMNMRDDISNPVAQYS